MRSPAASTIVSASPASIARIACWSMLIALAPPLESSITQRTRMPSFQVRSIAWSGASEKEAIPRPSTSFLWMPASASAATTDSAMNVSVRRSTPGWRS